MDSPGNRIQEKIPENDAALWEKFKNGDHQSFSLIYRVHIQSLYGYGRQIIKDSDLVEDCIQDLFIYIWNTRTKLGSTNNIKFYLFKSLRRKILAQLKSENKSAKTNNDMMAIHPETEASHEHSLIANETQESHREILKNAISHLTKRQREAIYLRFYDNLAFQEIADIMSLSLKSTYNLISKALDALKRKLHLFILLTVLLIS